MTGRRVVVTGLGAVSPLGMDVASTWSGLLEGRCGIETVTAFDPAGFTCKLAGQVGPYNINKHVPKSHRKAIKLMSRDIELSVMAANEAVADAGLVTRATQADGITIDPERTAVNFGAGLISCDLVELAPSVAVSITDRKFDIHKWGKAGLESLTPLWLLKYLPNMLACHVGIIHDIRGPSNTITCGEAGGQLAISEAAEMIARGDADVALAGGCEAKVNPLVMLRQCLLKRATDKCNDNPHGACRPFAADATGSVFGEAAGVLVLEEMGRAIKRGARIYAEVAGSGASNSINTVYERLEADGRGVELAIEGALADADVAGGQLDLIMPHGTGIADDDRVEANAIAGVLGDAVDNVSVWPTKSMLSHTGAAAGALDAIVAAKAVSQGRIGPAKNCQPTAKGCKLNISPVSLDREIKYAMCSSYTFGGQTAAIVLKRFDGE